MAFLVEHQSRGGSGDNNSIAAGPPLPYRVRSAGTAANDTIAPGPPLSYLVKPSSTMRITSAFKKTNSTSSNNGASPDSKRPSITEQERRSSLTTFPAILRRRRTKTYTERSEEEGRAASQLGSLFFNLPSEILTQIISRLSIHDVCALRQASRMTLSILDANASQITRDVLSQTLPKSLQRDIIYQLYPSPVPCTSTSHLLQVTHRAKIIDQMIYHTLSFINLKTYMLPHQNLITSTPNRARLITKLEAPAWTLYHFIESHRSIILSQHDSTHDQKTGGKFWSCQVCAAAIRDLVNSYPASVILPTYHLYQLIILHLRASTRAPAYSGTIARKIQGWGKNPASDEAISLVVILGGFEIMSQISMMQGSYNKRLEVITYFLDGVRNRIDRNEYFKRSTSTSQSASSRSPYAQNLTESLDPPLDTTTQEDLNRVPNLSDFFFGVWKERIQRDGLAKVDGEDSTLETPFIWVQSILYSDEDGSRSTSVNGNGQGQGQGQPVGIHGNGGFMTAPMMPMPLYGAPPV